MKRISQRVGFGYDSHRLVSGRPLFLGGVKIPFDQGLLGHSDADVLLHAIGDALLGAAGAGDLGRHFPDNDPSYKNISSVILLGHIRGVVEGQGYIISNIDSTVVLERPRLKEYINEMETVIARTLEVEKECVSVKATTNEGMGFVGRGEGIAAFSVVLLTSDPEK